MSIASNFALLLFVTGVLVFAAVRVMQSIKSHIDIRVDNISSEIAGTSKYIKDVADRMSSSAMTARYIRNGQSFEEDPGYMESLARIRAAKKSIRIIGDFSPDWMPLVPPKKRNAYFSAIEERVQEAIADPEITSFEYTRVIQRDKEIVQRVRESSDSPVKSLCQYDMLTDLDAYIHSYKVQQIKSECGSHTDGTKVAICLSGPVPNCPSILLVDERYMLFTIPTPIPHHGQLHHEQTSRTSRIGTHGVMLFEELSNGGAFSEAFSLLFTSVKEESVRVRVSKPDEHYLGSRIS
ncbi:MAG: hypothetical protein AAF171_15580 [Cyanobacteria bacterium P01_A01_bin.116]